MRIPAYANESLCWICPKGHKPYSMEVYRRTGQNQGCPECGGKTINGQKKSLANSRPELVKRFIRCISDPSKKPEEIGLRDELCAWMCSGCELPFVMRVDVLTNSYKTHKKVLCTNCSAAIGGRKKTQNALKNGAGSAAKYPELVEQYRPELNGGKRLEEFVESYDAEKFTWYCRKYDQTWEATIHARCKAKSKGCPICSGKELRKNINDFKSFARKIASEWDYERNAGNPEDYSIYDRQSRFWICSICKKPMEKTASIQDRVKNGLAGCQSCRSLAKRGKLHINGTFVTYDKIQDTFARSVMEKQSFKPYNGNNSAGSVPELVEQYNPLKNSGISLSLYSKNSDEVVIWTCKKYNIDYPEQILNRTGLKDKSCPVCSGKLFVGGINDLLSTNKEVAADWDEERNGWPANEQSIADSDKREWKCQFCGHNWSETVIKHLKERPGCEDCRKTTPTKGVRTLDDY